MKIFKIESLKEFSIFFWIILITILGIFVTLIYKSNKNEQTEKIKSTLDNIYFHKTIKEITENLSPRYTNKIYISKSGDTHQSIINKLDINKKEKKILLNAILNEKSLKILRINQKFSFKFDNLSDDKIKEFKIETDKKNVVLFRKSNTENIFKITKIKKNFIKNLVYKETIITESLYNSAINLGIKPNIIIEFARIYGFQVDFQRDIWKNDSFQIIYEEYVNENNMIVDTGEILFANLNLQNTIYNFINLSMKKTKLIILMKMEKV